MDYSVSHMLEIYQLTMAYDKDFIAGYPEGTVFLMNIREGVSFGVHFHKEYPSQGPPGFHLEAPQFHNNPAIIEQLSFRLDAVYRRNIGQYVVKLWIETVRQMFEEIYNGCCSRWKFSLDLNMNNNDAQMMQGELVVDEGFKFQAHLCEIASPVDVVMVQDQLLRKDNIAQGSYHVMAYTVIVNSVLYESFNNCGVPDNAGRKLLRLLNIFGVRNTVIIVTCWTMISTITAEQVRLFNTAGRKLLLEHARLNWKLPQRRL